MNFETSDKSTTIHIHQSTKARLMNMRVHERETPEDIILRMIKTIQNKQLVC